MFANEPPVAQERAWRSVRTIFYYTAFWPTCGLHILNLSGGYRDERVAGGFSHICVKRKPSSRYVCFVSRLTRRYCTGWRSGLEVAALRTCRFSICKIRTVRGMTFASLFAAPRPPSDKGVCL